MKLLVIALVTAVMLGCSANVEQTTTFQGISMLPTIKDGEKIRLLRFDRGAKFDVKRGDIVVFLFPGNTSEIYVKRLIGLPGDSVEIRDDKVFVNGEELSEPYVSPEFNKVADSRPPVTVKEHSYYVLGDNRDNSSDSRSWGLVPEKNILGKAVNK
jgi:signal peptidase I